MLQDRGGGGGGGRCGKGGAGLPHCLQSPVVVDAELEEAEVQEVIILVQTQLVVLTALAVAEVEMKELVALWQAVVQVL